MIQLNTTETMTEFIHEYRCSSRSPSPSNTLHVLQERKVKWRL